MKNPITFLEKRINNALLLIDKEIKSNIDLSSGNLGLAGGLAGVAIYLCSRRQESALEENDHFIDQILDAIYERINNSENFNLAFYSGIAGIGYALELIAKNRVGITLEVEGMNEDVDDFIFNNLQYCQHFDLVWGLVGLGVYALGRTSALARKKLFFPILEVLRKSTVISANGFSWRTQPQFMGTEKQSGKYPEGNFNLGVAHGVPGVLGLFNLAHKLEFNDDFIKLNIRETSKWICSNIKEDFGSAFESIAGDNHPSRLAWCYGDPGVSLQLVSAAKILADEELLAAGMSIATKAISRFKTTSKIKDHGLCHGSAGLMITYGKLYYLTGYTPYLEAAEYWCDRILTSIENSATEGLTSLYSWNGEGQYVKKLGLLEGMSGIGLSLQQFKNKQFNYLQWLLI